MPEVWGHWSYAGMNVREPFDPDGVPNLLKPREVASLFRTSSRVVSRWADAGRLQAIRTPGGVRLFPLDQFDSEIQRMWRERW